MSDVDIMTDHAVLDAKSIMGVYALDLSEDTFLSISEKSKLLNFLLLLIFNSPPYHFFYVLIT